MNNYDKIKGRDRDVIRDALHQRSIQAKELAVECRKVKGQEALAKTFDAIAARAESVYDKLEELTTKGTPTTLLQAIENAIPIHIENDLPGLITDPAPIKAHVRDFLAQHFSKPMLEAPTQEESDRFKALFERIVK